MGIAALEVEYRPVPGYEGYRVGSDGSVWSRRRLRGKSIRDECGDMWHRMSPSFAHGYARLQFHRYGRGRAYFVHDLVLTAFIGPRPLGQQSRHLDGDRANNRIENLAWGTAKENAEDKKRHARERQLQELRWLARSTKGNVELSRTPERVLGDSGAGNLILTDGA